MIMIFANLTEIEQQLLLLLVEGMTSDEIGKLLGKSKSTVEHQIAELREKTGHTSRLSLVIAYYKSMLCTESIQEEINILDAKIAECKAKLEVYCTMRQIKFNQWLKIQR